MYHTYSCLINSKNSLFYYLNELCSNSKNLYNTTNYFIRQIYSAFHKNETNLQINEKEVLNIVNHYLPQLDEIKLNTLKKKLNKLESKLTLSSNDSIHYLEEEIINLKIKIMNYKPIQVESFIKYEILDGIFKLSNNVDYRNLPSQINQQIMKQVYNAWNSFFKTNKDYKLNPSKYLGKPKIPQYKKSKLSNARLTNQLCKLKIIEDKTYLKFPKTNDLLYLGNYIKENSNLQYVEVIPYYGQFKVNLIFLDKRTYKEVTDKDNRIFGIDLGVNNFATITNNIEIQPIIIKGKVLKSRNQYFNKYKAELTSLLKKNKATKDNKSSKKLDTLYRKRDNFFRDYFYKISHYIVNYALKNKIDTIVIGKNEYWKQESKLNKKNNQNFISLPYKKFIEILSYLCMKNGIKITLQEESYTSKTSFLDKDDIPIYKKNDNKQYEFSGKRISRGLYQTKAGQLINADINGSANIIKKYREEAFNDISDYKYLLAKPMILNIRDFYTNKKR